MANVRVVSSLSLSVAVKYIVVGVSSSILYVRLLVITGGSSTGV